MHGLAAQPLVRDHAALSLIVAVATVPPRFHLLNTTIANVGRQTLQPSRLVVILAKAYTRFPMDDTALTAVRARIASAGAHTYVRETDLGPVTKLIGALEYMRMHMIPATLATSTLITIDEDMVYPVWCFENMVQWARVLPDACIANAGGEYNGPKQPPRYIGAASRPWLSNARGIQPRPPCTAVRANYIYGWSAVLYRPHFFDERLWSHISWLANGSSPADDQYISGHLGLRGVPIVLVPPRRVSHYWPAMFAQTKYARTMRHDQLHSDPDDQWRPLEASSTSAARPEENEKRTNKRAMLQHKMAVIDGVLARFGGSDFWVANASYVQHKSWCKGESKHGRI